MLVLFNGEKYMPENSEATKGLYIADMPKKSLCTDWDETLSAGNKYPARYFKEGKQRNRAIKF